MSSDTKTKNISTATCPTCSKPTDVKYRPFCSKRCADVDLGKWFSEDYILPGNAEIPDNLDDVDALDKTSK